jgi:transcriptional regulator with XRE-family HTH domain
MPDESAARKNPLGPIGAYVIANLKQLREVRGLTYQKLSDRLRELGRPIPTLGLSRIENGNRRVDADDLVARARARDVNPAALLLPRDTAPGDEVQLAPELPVAAVAAWEWSAGRFPLVPGDVTWQRLADFEMHARPDWHGASAVEWRDELERRKAEMEELGREPQRGKPS